MENSCKGCKIHEYAFWASFPVVIYAIVMFLVNNISTGLILGFSWFGFLVIWFFLGGVHYNKQHCRQNSLAEV